MSQNVVELKLQVFVIIAHIDDRCKIRRQFAFVVNTPGSSNGFSLMTFPENITAAYPKKRFCMFEIGLIMKRPFKICRLFAKESPV